VAIALPPPALALSCTPELKADVCHIASHCVRRVQTESGWAKQASLDAVSAAVSRRVDACEQAQGLAQRRMDAALAAEVARVLELNESHATVARSIAEERSDRMVGELLGTIEDRCQHMERHIEGEKKLGRAAAQRLREEVALMAGRAGREPAGVGQPQPEPEPEPEPES
jgi:hypothetical protein